MKILESIKCNTSLWVVRRHGKDDQGQHCIEHAVPWTGLDNITYNSCVGLTSLWELNRRQMGDKRESW